MEKKEARDREKVTNNRWSQSFKIQTLGKPAPCRLDFMIYYTKILNG